MSSSWGRARVRRDIDLAAADVWRALTITPSGGIEAWHPDDFSVARRLNRSGSSDFWCPEPAPSTLAPDPPPARSCGDFWDPDPACSIPPPTVAAGGWFSDAALPDYDPAARTSPFAVPFVTRRRTAAQRRATWLVGLLDLPSQRERRLWIERFEEIFEEFDSPATFRALSDLALDEASASELWDAVEFRRIWLSTPLWWSMRARGRQEPYQAGPGAVGWARAYRWIIRAGATSAEELIGPDWFEDWLLLRPSPHYWRFSDYIESRLSSATASFGFVQDEDGPDGAALRDRLGGFSSPSRFSELYHRVGLGVPRPYLGANLAYAGSLARI